MPQMESLHFQKFAPFHSHASTKVIASTIALVLLALTALLALKIYRQFARNLATAKASGIKYTWAPFILYNRYWQLACIVIVPIVRRLPKSWTEPWFDMTLFDWGWNRRYEPFKRIGSDTFMVVTLERNILYTADADVISQITTRRNDFPKPLEIYGSVSLYGKNVVASEGQLWRHHRKITSLPFSEKNNHLVFAETLSQCQDMVDSWMDGEKESSKTIHTVGDDALRLSLHVISRGGLGVSLKWPAKAKATENGLVKVEKDNTSSASIPEGHTMSYSDALGSLIHSILPLLICPKSLLRNLPFQWAKTAYTSYNEWGNYMDEMIQAKKAAVLTGTEGDKLDLMIAMIKGAGTTAESASKGEASRQTLSDDEVLGNAFIFILAGHETTANSIHCCLALLAMNIAAQRDLQSDLDAIFQGRPPSQWDYDQDIPKLFGSMAGAVMNEELRLVPPVINIPKHTPKGSPQPLIIDGKKCTVPENTFLTIVTAATHRNPNQWPSGPPSDPDHPTHPLSNLDNDLEEFKPERWLLDPSSKTSTTKVGGSAGIAGMPDQESETEASPSNLYHPPKGAYIPFSEGYRSCLGRRFAQVEILAALALIFSQYSVELAVDAYATDEEVERMGEGERKGIWEKARWEVERQLREDMGSVITFRLRKGGIGLRCVRRGGERFNW